ncbi:hypothetical protein Tco_1285203 [Tanacetum coccineum]
MRKRREIEDGREVASNVEGEEEDGLGGDGFVVDGGRSPSTLSRDGDDGGVENKSFNGTSKQQFSLELIFIGDSDGEIIGEVGGALDVLVLFSLGIVKKGKTQEVGVKKMAKNCALFIEKDGQE